MNRKWFLLLELGKWAGLGGGPKGQRQGTGGCLWFPGAVKE